MQATFLPMGLRLLSRHLELRATTGVGMTPQDCERVSKSLRLAACQADDLAGKASDAGELEDELHIVAADLESVMPSSSLPPTSPYQAALKAQQAAIQRELDAGEPTPGHVSRRAGLARLSIPLTEDGRVVALPLRGPAAAP